MTDSDFLKKIDALKKQTFTNEKIAETLGCSVSTVKRALREIKRGALISPTRKWGLTSDAIFFEEMFEEVRILAQKPLAEWMIKARTKTPDRYGAVLYGSGVVVDPLNDIEKNWLKRYKRAVKEGRTVSEGF